MRSNPVKQKLAAGEIAVGTMMMEFATPGIGRIAAAAGAEFAVLDMEHSAWTKDTIRWLIAASRSADLVPMVRPPCLEYHFIASALDMGAMGVVLPFIDEVEQAEFAVRCAKYPPDGRRGAAFNIAHDDFRASDIPETMRTSNANVLVVVQIETARALENVERIARVPGVDALWIGQFDLSASMGIPGEVKHPEFLKAQERILQACNSAGIAAGFGSLIVEDIVAAKAQGFRFLVYVTDLWIYQRALRQGLDQVRGRS